MNLRALKKLVAIFIVSTLSLSSSLHAEEDLSSSLGEAPIIDLGDLTLLAEPMDFSGAVLIRDASLTGKEVNIKTNDFIQIAARITLPVHDFFTLMPSVVYVELNWNGETFLYGKDQAGQPVVHFWQKPIHDYPWMHLEQTPTDILVPLFEGVLAQPGDMEIKLALFNNNRFYASSPTPIKIRVNQSEPSRLEGDFIARSGFLPNPDGFGFPNYGDILETDLATQDMISFLGEEHACYLSGSDQCFLTAYARQAKKKILEEMEGGHCYGMAVAAMRLKKGLSFKGMTAPTDYQDGAESTLELQKPYVRNLIAYYFYTQYLGIVEYYTDPANTQKPSEILQTVINRMNTDDPIVVLGIMQRNGEGGHAITPYAVQDQGNGEFAIYVYDNNFPDDAGKKLIINPTAETWSYVTSINPEVPPEIYEGDLSTPGHLVAIPLSAHDNLPTLEISESTAEFQFSGQGLEMLIENWEEQRIGYDFANDMRINEIPGAEVRHVWEPNASPGYLIPFEAPRPGEYASPEAYRDAWVENMFFVDLKKMPGQQNPDATSSALYMRSGGNIVEIGNINLRPGETTFAFIHPSAEMVGLVNDKDQQPTITLQTDNPAQQVGYLYELSGLEIAEGTMLQVMTGELGAEMGFSDPTSGTLPHIVVASVPMNADTDFDMEDFTLLDSSTYSLRVTKITAFGERMARRADISLPVGAKARVSVKEWGDDSTTFSARAPRSGKARNPGLIEVEIFD